jgi:transmembrane sensor
MSTVDRKADAISAQAIAEQAATWFVAHREKPLNESERQEFLTWLQASPLHVREYLSVARMSLDLRAVVSKQQDSAENLVAAARSERAHNVIALPVKNSTRVRSRYVLTALAATVAAVAIGVTGWWQMAQTPQHEQFLTAHGEQRTVRLDDGSVLHINSDSLVSVDFSGSERRVFIERGQALFKVAKDKTRPFRVRAGSTEVVAVGTEFDVRRGDDNVLVTVVEGQVAVAKLANAAAPALNVMAMPLRLTAGQQARVVVDAAPIVRQAVDVRPAVAWVQQQILFERETLQDVIAEFNRYGTTQMVIQDSEIAMLRISGTFNAYDLDSFVLYLEKLNGLAVQRDVDRIRISITRQEGGRT